jgi:DNA-binding MarR family transcriptional regulator
MGTQSVKTRIATADTCGEQSRDSAEYAGALAELFVEIVHKSEREALNCCESDEVTYSLVECLRHIRWHNPSSVNQIAFALGVSVSAASQLVERLVKKGLVSRSENENDRRLTFVRIEPAGIAIVDKVRGSLAEWFGRALESMQPERKSALVDGLEGFIGAALSKESEVERACARCGMEHVAYCVVNRLKQESAKNWDK